MSNEAIKQGCEFLTRTLHPEIRVADEAQGLVEYVASDETLDSYREVIRASGWRFTHFQKNAPFVDSHDYSSVRNLLGQVVDFRVARDKLIETVQWARDVGNDIADIGWRLTVAGFLKAVSVGFYPVRMLTKFSQGEDSIEFARLKDELGLKDQDVRAIYTEQEQIELSACVIGANPNALARAYKAEVLSDEDLNTISARVAESQENAKRQLATPPASAGEDGEAIRRRQLAVLLQLHNIIKAL